MTQLFNASEYLLDRRIAAGDGARVALTGPAGDLSYAELHDRVRRTAAGLRAAGVQPEQRIVMVMADSPQFVVVYLAAMRVGAIPVPVSTMLRSDGIAELLRDSRARFLAVTSEFAAAAESAVAAAPELAGVLADIPLSASTRPVHLVSPGGRPPQTPPVYLLDELAGAAPDDSVYDTSADSPAFWLYTSGTTGTPKGAMHRHGSVEVVCETYGKQVLGIRPEDRCLSAAKAFFAYGLGNSVLFPMSVGAASVLLPSPSRPDVIAETAAKHGATLFFGGPTFFANMLRAGLAPDALGGVRLAASAGEALPAALYQRWTSHFGIDIIDGIGMTEMLHIFLSNAPGAVKPGTTGVPVPGYDLKLVDEDTGAEVLEAGHAGTLFVRGSSTATGYWARYDASRLVYQGEWLRTGDTYVRDADGYYECLGRTGDMIKASGIWVSPMEVEARLLSHPAVAQAVVVAARDADSLEKPVAYVVLAPGAAVTEAELIEHCREALPSFKRPRAVVFTDGFPTTATGKIRRVELRTMAANVLRPGSPPASGLASPTPTPTAAEAP
ncbi:benzoate-CoA ligase family protein [Trebonia kvetii]|uniref:Benzoate-CoA ligase family protein n=1 Tax=Trebonia kvetii TaxID=2480626 RepID=A0A6P2BP73_9ACTN|nr:benzoate-CoA ligase family protein [Trebonia kvetii]TVZ00802.1 benzoate-CoA ligase family protein [Trebonia kvetii]